MAEVAVDEAVRNKLPWAGPRQLSSERAVPPWAEPDAQPPPPPSSVYSPMTSSPRLTRPTGGTMTSATETQPFPQHFNRPSPGASPVAPRKSLFRINPPKRASSDESLTRTGVPWAQHRGRTDSPSRIKFRPDSPSRAAFRSDSPSRTAPRTDSPSRIARRTDSPTVTPRTDSPSMIVSTAESTVRTESISQKSHINEFSSVTVEQKESLSLVSEPPSCIHKDGGRDVNQSNIPTHVTSMGGQAASGRETQSQPPQPSQVSTTPIVSDTALSKRTQQCTQTIQSSTSVSRESQVSPKSLPPEQSSPTPWRRAVKNQVPGAKAAPTHQPPWREQKLSPSDVCGSGESSTSVSTPSSEEPTKQAPWRKATAVDPGGTVNTVQQKASVSPAPTSAGGVNIISKETTVITQAKQSDTKGKTEARGGAQVAVAQPSWRRQHAKTPPGASASAVTAAGAAAGAAAAEAALNVTRSTGSPVSGATLSNTQSPAPQPKPPSPLKEPDLTPVDKTVSVDPAIKKLSPETSDKPTSPASAAKKQLPPPDVKKNAVLTSAPDQQDSSVPAVNKILFAVDVADKPTSPAPVHGVDKPVSPARIFGKPASPALAVSKPVTPALAVSKPVSPAPVVDKPATTIPVAGKAVSSSPVAAKAVSPAPALDKPVPTAAASKSVFSAPVATKSVSTAPVVGKPTSPAPVLNKSVSPAPTVGKSILSIPSDGKPVSPTPAVNQPVSFAPSAVTPVPPAEDESVCQVPVVDRPVSPASVNKSASPPPAGTNAAVTTAQAVAGSGVVTTGGGTPERVSAGRDHVSPAAAVSPSTSASACRSPTPPLPPRQCVITSVSPPSMPHSQKTPAALLEGTPAPSVVPVLPLDKDPGIPTPEAMTSTVISQVVPIPPPPPIPNSTTGTLKTKIPSIISGISTIPSLLTSQQSLPDDDSSSTSESSSTQSGSTSKTADTVIAPPNPEFPPPPPFEDSLISPPSNSDDSGLPHPPLFAGDEARIVSPPGFLAHIQEEGAAGDLQSPEYVRESVTKRIQAFEKQASREEDSPPPERSIGVPRPVAPWVKRTSSGPVNQASYWDMTSPEEAQKETWPAPPPSAQRHTEQTTSRQLTKSPDKGSVKIPAAPLAPPLTTKAPTYSTKVAPSTAQSPLLCRRTTSTGDYQAQYITPEASAKSSKMPAEGTSPVTTPSAPSPVSPVSKDMDNAPSDPWCDPKNPKVINFQDVSAAAFKIKSGIMNTPCTRSHMSSFTGMEIYFKKEFNQYTGSFKERGARYTLLMLPPEQQKTGVIAASAGNHALALSYHGQDLGIPVTVVMPLVAPIMKVQACRQYGANVIVKGNDIGECREIALKMSKEKDLVYINGYDHPHILAGQGTMGLEIVEQVPNIDAVVIPVGGGGLVAGVALAVKALYPNVKVIGVESERCASFSAAIKAGHPVYVKAESTLADGLAVPMVGVNAFATAAPLVDKVVTVREEWIAIAILRLVECEKAVVEGAGATALAAILAGELPELKDKRVVIPLCGGNIDTTVLGRCLERGLAADGRLVKFTVTVSDRPGGIAELTRLLANLGVSIKDMLHERAWIKNDIFSVEVKALCETRDQEHSEELRTTLLQHYKILRFGSQSMANSSCTTTTDGGH